MYYVNWLRFGQRIGKKEINLILIDNNQVLLDYVSDYLGISYSYQNKINYFIKDKSPICSVSNYKIEVLKLYIDYNDMKSYESIEKSIISKDIGILGK